MSIYQDLFAGLTQLKCPEALKCFQIHWMNAPSAVKVPRSIVLANRGVEVMEEIKIKSKSKYLSVKFMNSNSNM